MTAGTATDPAVELVTASVADTTSASNNTGRDNSEIADDTNAGHTSISTWIYMYIMN